MCAKYFICPKSWPAQKHFSMPQYFTQLLIWYGLYLMNSKIRIFTSKFFWIICLPLLEKWWLFLLIMNQPMYQCCWTWFIYLVYLFKMCKYNKIIKMTKNIWNYCFPCENICILKLVMLGKVWPQTSQSSWKKYII